MLAEADTHMAYRPLKDLFSPVSPTYFRCLSNFVYIDIPSLLLTGYESFIPDGDLQDVVSPVPNSHVRHVLEVP